MHLAHEVVHLRECVVVLVDHDVDAVVEDVELGVGDDARDLDDRVALDVEAGHLEIEPHQLVVVGTRRHAPHAIRAVVGPPMRNVAPVRFGAGWLLPPSSGAPTSRCCERATWPASCTAERIADFPTLVQRSIDEPEWFWDAVVRFLGLPFATPYERVLDTSAGIEWATWFVGGRGNAASMCLDRLPAATSPR